MSVLHLEEAILLLVAVLLAAALVFLRRREQFKSMVELDLSFPQEESEEAADSNWNLQQFF